VSFASPESCFGIGCGSFSALDVHMLNMKRAAVAKGVKHFALVQNYLLRIGHYLLRQVVYASLCREFLHHSKGVEGRQEFQYCNSLIRNNINSIIISGMDIAC
jgi:hypothetical protein